MDGRLDPAPPHWSLPARWNLHYRPVTGSTNDDARDLALAGCPERTIILTDEQVAGRGRLGRQWIAPPQSGLLFSMVLRRFIPPVLCTAACSVAIAEAIGRSTGLEARIKWPNDVMVRDRKACGILTEVLARDGSQATVVGIGLNVNADPRLAGWPPTATSLSHEYGAPVSRERVLRGILEGLDAYLALDDAELARIIQGRWESLLWRLWQDVRIDQSGTSVTGVVEGLSPSGALRVRTADGVLELAVGDVS